MHIESLECKNFRNYRALTLAFSPGINILYGDNAQGKTNLLEAIRLAGTTRSHRMARDAEMISFGEAEAHLRLQLRGNGGARRIDMHLRRSGPKGIAIDGVPIRKASELMGTLHTCLFSPEDLAIVKSGPKERRRFLDAELCQLSGRYFAELSAYNKVVLQRNALLKEFSRRRDMADTLEIWDEQLLAHGLPLLAARRDFLAELSELAAGQHAQLSGEKEALQLAYEPDVDEEHFAAELAANHTRDLALRTTTTGPHRDDIGVRVNDIDLRRFGSQGQQRTAALSLKLAEIALVRQRTGEDPVLLLDDVFSELDAHRQELLLSNVSGTQTFITCTGVEGLLEKFPQAAKYRIKEGKANNGDGDLC